MHFIKTGQLVDLSTRELEQCCNASMMSPTFDCVQKLGGICSAASYPDSHTCQSKQCTPVAKVSILVWNFSKVEGSYIWLFPFLVKFFLCMYIHGREHEVKQMGSFIQYIYFDKYSLHRWQRGSIMGDEWFVCGGRGWSLHLIYFL